MQTKIVILGSTGSIGLSALNIVRRYPEMFKVVGLAAGGNSKLLESQIKEFKPEVASLIDPISLSISETKLIHGSSASIELLDRVEYDLAIASIVGIAGLPSAYKVLTQGKRLLLANKESLVCAGQLLIETAKSTGAQIVPIDSEHSALAQLLELVRATEVDSLTLTASGGPFLNLTEEQISLVTPAQAVKHPRWNMGPKVSVDSSTLVNKALELVEACWLFQLPEDRVNILVHPESIVHSLVNLIDGVQIAHLSVPDMQGPIGFAMGRPRDRPRGILPPLDLTKIRSLNFLPLDENRFKAVNTMRECFRMGGTACAIFNSANEWAVSSFLKGLISWKEIEPTIRKSLDKFSISKYSTVEELMELHHKVIRSL